jgi:undecaprenyl-diphosphatase
MNLAQPHPHSLSPRGLAIAGWAGFLAAGALFITLAWNVAAHTHLLLLDASVSSWLHARRVPALTQVMLAVSDLHSPGAVVAWTAIFALILTRLREWYWMLTLALSVGGGMLVNQLLKVTYERARPHFDDPLLSLTSYSFPSGHTAAATVFYGTLAAFLVSRFYDHRVRAAIVSCALAAIAWVAFSRIYLGAHYLSDVTAAMCSSTAWLVLCLSGVHALVRHRMDRPK